MDEKSLFDLFETRFRFRLIVSLTSTEETRLLLSTAYFIRAQLSGKRSAAVTQPHNWCLQLIAYCLPWRSGKNVSFIWDVFRSRVGRKASVDDTFRNTIQSALSSHIKHSSIGFKEALNYTDDKYFPWPALYRSPQIRQREGIHRDQAPGNTITFNKNDLPFSSSIINKL